MMRIHRLFIRMFSKLLQVLLLSMMLLSVIYAKSTKSTSVIEGQGQKILSALEKNYGDRAEKRGKAWLKLMKPKSALSNRALLEKVNRFFNIFHFIDDIKLWGVKNYWATPVEFIGVNGGDCEDFSIAKYFTLLELGIPDKKMRLTMVKAVQLNQYHMVVAYYKTPSSIPLILDNIDGVIKPANKRHDLIPIYSFNGSQLWLNQEKGRGKIYGKSSRIKLWRDLLQRMTNAKLKQPKLKMEF